MNKILVVRNDKIGDFVLAFPALALLKRSLPGVEVCALVPEYTRELAEQCEWIDRVVLDPSGPHTARRFHDTLRLLRREKFDAVISLFSTTRVGLAAALARVPIRVAPATKLAQTFQTLRVRQKRSQSAKPEHEYNVELAGAFLDAIGIAPAPLPDRPYLRLEDRDPTREGFCESLNLPASAPLAFLHPGSGGSARNLSLHQYASLAAALYAETGCSLVLSAGPGEQERVANLSRELRQQSVPHAVYSSTAGLKEFVRHVRLADVFIGGSTGPLHIAGALDVPTAGFYPRRRSATALRWQTLNSPDRRLAVSPPASAGEEDMESVDVIEAAHSIGRHFLIK